MVLLDKMMPLASEQLENERRKQTSGGIYGKDQNESEDIKCHKITVLIKE